ncbi:hypothetical protein AJ79_06912 [Helicocarpus griseus UAMH5409]|uniref:Pyroglutamyl-peptidase I n=1 Tax=Helicocarpus griseus UAMH5409 TaxID=1447875 RepID=A0A2B7X7T1_9EURO|nr:hypothetical protein AJ79_06912 [Helicocarpus griseus UAMH5409]
MGDLGPAISEDHERLPDSPTVTKESVEDVKVLVTGFGPFKTNPLNPSFLIASSLPETVTLPQTTSSPPRRIRIHTHPFPIRVAYSAVRSAVPEIIESFKNNHDGRPPDLIIHIGMASTRDYYAVETVAHRDGYRITDVDGEVGYEDGEAHWKDLGLPDVLRPGPCTISSDGGQDAAHKKRATTVYTTTGISTTSTIVTDTTTVDSTNTTTTTTTTTTSSSAPEEQQDQRSIRNTIVTTITSTAASTPTSPSPPDAHFLKTWRSFTPESTDVRISEDAGRYLCEFIFYTSMAQAYREGRDRSVVFLHVPGRTDEESIEVGKEVAVGLVKCIVSCWVD